MEGLDFIAGFGGEAGGFYTVFAWYGYNCVVWDSHEGDPKCNIMDEQTIPCS